MNYSRVNMLHLDVTMIVGAGDQLPYGAELMEDGLTVFPHVRQVPLTKINNYFFLFSIVRY